MVPGKVYGTDRKSRLIQSVARRLTHTDIDLLLLRMQLTPGQPIQAMLDATLCSWGFIGGRLPRLDPDLTDPENHLENNVL